jgi:hypothetical protein
MLLHVENDTQGKEKSFHYAVMTPILTSDMRSYLCPGDVLLTRMIGHFPIIKLVSGRIGDSALLYLCASACVCVQLMYVDVTAQTS